MTKHKNARRRGEAAIESALTTLTLAMVLIGIFDLGQVLFVHQTFVSRARSAVRYGVVGVWDEAAVRNMVLYGQPSPGPSTIFGLTPDMVSVTRPGVGTGDQRLVVAVSGYPCRFFSPWIGGVFTGRAIVASLPLETP
jgi:hypothetical protein